MDEIGAGAKTALMERAPDPDANRNTSAYFLGLVWVCLLTVALAATVYVGVRDGGTGDDYARAAAACALLYGATVFALPGLALAAREHGGLASIGWAQLAITLLLGVTLATVALTAKGQRGVTDRVRSGDLAGVERDLRLSGVVVVAIVGLALLCLALLISGGSNMRGLRGALGLIAGGAVVGSSATMIIGLVDPSTTSGERYWPLLALLVAAALLSLIAGAVAAIADPIRDHPQNH